MRAGRETQERGAVDENARKDRESRHDTIDPWMDAVAQTQADPRENHRVARKKMGSRGQRSGGGKVRKAEGPDGEAGKEPSSATTWLCTRMARMRSAGGRDKPSMTRPSDTLLRTVREHDGKQETIGDKTFIQ